jgi:hypothetical protein
MAGVIHRSFAEHPRYSSSKAKEKKVYTSTVPLFTFF